MTAHRPRKFFIFYDIDGDEVGIVLRTDEYDGDEDCSWVLLEPIDGTAGASGAVAGDA